MSLCLDPADLPGLYSHTPRRYGDDRGFFCEPFASGDGELASSVSGYRDAHVFSQAGVLRGLHYTVLKPSPKCVWVSQGQVFDVVVDLRRDSPTFGRHCTFHLNGDEPRVIVIPAGMAHGYCVLSTAGAHVHYKLGGEYDPADEAGLRWNDPELAVAWPLTDVITNVRDGAWPCLADGPRLPARSSCDEGVK